MAFIKKVKSDKSKDKIVTLKMRKAELTSKIESMQKERIQIEKEILEIEFSPFKVNDHVLYEVVTGKTKKETKCLLELEVDESNGTCSFYARPFKSDGSLSGRHFRVVSKTKLSLVE